MTMQDRLAAQQMEGKFSAWLEELRDGTVFHDDLIDTFTHELREQRHVLLVNMRQFFMHAMDEQVMESDCPIALITKGSPFAILDSYPEVSVAAKFCASVGLSWEIHVYEKISSSVH